MAREKQKKTSRAAGPWRNFGIGALLCLAVYAGGSFVETPRPSSWWGLSYGIAAAVLVIATALYGLRRRMPGLAARFKLGRAQVWLDFHLWGGGLFLVLMLMHSAFQLPTGLVTWCLWLLGLWTVATGLAGRFLQLWLPRALGSGLATEALYERIPELVDELRQRAEKVAADAPETVRGLYMRHLAPVLAGPQPRWIYFIDITGGRKAQLTEVDYLRRFLGGNERERLEELAGLVRTKIDLDAQYTLERLLRVWLWAHLPPVILLIAFLVLHVFAVLYY